MNYEKIAPSLLSVLKDYEEEGANSLRNLVETVGVVGDMEKAGPPRMSVFLHCDANADLSNLAEKGVVVNQRVGPIRTAFLPLSRIEQVSEERKIRQIIASRYLDVLMDVAPGEVNLPRFRSKSGLSGKNVIVGIVDTGIDSNHPAFAGRILRLWDQTLSGGGVAEGGYGAELLPGNLTLSRDTVGHGTHIAGIAGGSDPTYQGVAPCVQYVIVKSDLADTHIVDGVNYICRVASELSMPVVVNLSLGGHYDPHDGTDPLSTVLDGHAGKGKIICCAAGNEGSDDIHAAAQVPAGGIGIINFSLWPSSASAKGELNGWYSGKDHFDICVKCPSGYQTPFQGIATSGIPFRDYKLPDGQVRIITPGPNPTNGDHNFVVEVTPDIQPSENDAPSIWTLVLRGKTVNLGRVDIWAPREAVFAPSSAGHDMKIGTPGACASAITVGSYTTKNQWIDLEGQAQSENFVLHTMTAFSSPGPLRNGARKPDLAAPGTMIAAPASGQAVTDLRWMVAQGFRLNAGTSMATPFISGIVALLLERNRSLDPTAIKSILHGAASVPNRATGTFDVQWGYGLLNALGL